MASVLRGAVYVIFCYTSVGMTAFRCAGTHGEILKTIG